jgi:hypothetical protein
MNCEYGERGGTGDDGRGGGGWGEHKQSVGVIQAHSRVKDRYSAYSTSRRLRE